MARSTRLDKALSMRTGTIHTNNCAAWTKAMCRAGYVRGTEISQEAAAEKLAKGEGQLCKACAKQAANEAPVEVEVRAEVAAIAEALDKGAHTAKTHESMSALTSAAALVLTGEFEAARKVLVPLRTRVALAGIKAIKAL